jgi:hypothetical protein
MADDSTDVFGYKSTLPVRQPGFKDPASSEGLLKLDSKPVALIQNWSVQYQMNVTPIYECGSSTVTWSAKHGSGTLQIGRIINEDPTETLASLGTVCVPKDPQITAYSGCDNVGKPVVLTLTGCVAASIGFSGQAQNAYISEDIGAQFAMLKVSGGGQQGG